MQQLFKQLLYSLHYSGVHLRNTMNVLTIKKKFVKR